MAVPLRVLLLEDNPDDAELIVAELRQAEFAPDWRRVDTEAEYLAALEPTLDLILADYSLPQFDSLRALELLHERELDIPFVIVSGTIGEERAVRAIQQGAADYIIKDRLARLGSAVSRALQQKRLAEEKRQAESALRRAKEEAEAANRLKTDFLATLSHELRTPLNIIIGYTTLLLEEDAGPLSPEQLDMLRPVVDSAHELFGLICSILDVSRLEAGRAPVEFAEVDLNGLLTEVRQETERANAKADVTMAWQVASPLPTVRTDRTKVKMVLTNLLSNALKFTEQGTVTVEVSLQGEQLELCVRDTGVGIAPEVMPYIFEMFRQGDSSPTRRYSGVGLGLYTVRRVLEMLGGAITVDSAPGHGSTFRVQLPLGQRLKPD